MTKKDWAHDLATGIAAALDMFDPPDDVDEKLLARVLRQCASASDDLGNSLFLRSLADAFDHPNATRPVGLVKAKRGRPPQPQAKFDRVMLVGPFVTEQLIAGRKKESAIQEAMTEFRLSRSVVIRAQTDYEKFRRVFDQSRDNPTQRHMSELQLVLDRELARRRLRSKKART